MIILFFFILHWYLSLFFQTFFLHRYASHRMFEMSPFTERVFYILTFICQGSSYLSPRAYGVMHRMHHEHADTEHDPHSPKHDGTLFKMMWKSYKVYNGIFTGKIEVAKKYQLNVPDWERFDRIACSLWMRIAWVLGYIAFYYIFSPSFWLFLLLPIHAFMGPVHGAIVNWFSHKYGYINFEMENASTNLMKLDLLMMGEGLHNNHHKFPSRINFGVKKHEFDPTYPLIKLLHQLGIIRFRNKVEVSIRPKLWPLIGPGDSFQKV